METPLFLVIGNEPSLREELRESLVRLGFACDRLSFVDDLAQADRVLAALRSSEAERARGKYPKAGLDTPRLSPRETEILAMIDKGLSNREVSELLSLSRLTVESHLRNAYKKLAVGSRTEAIFEARAQGLFT